MPKVSVIVPVYNAEQYLVQCLESIISQTLNDIEIICVDDGSTDSSLKILEDFARKDSRITVIKQKNMYAGVARNNALNIAKGDYIAFFDSDDYIAENALEVFYKKAYETNSDIVVCRMYDVFENKNQKKVVPVTYNLDLKLIGDKNEFSYKDFPATFLQIFTTGPCDKLFRRELLNKYNIRFSDCRSCEDIRFTTLALVFAEKVSYIYDYCLYHRVLHTSLNFTRNSYNIFKEYSSIKNDLISNKLWQVLEQSFINDLCRSVFYHYCIANNLIEKYKICKYIKNVMYKEYNMDKYKNNFFYIDSQISFYREINSYSILYNILLKKIWRTVKLIFGGYEW